MVAREGLAHWHSHRATYPPFAIWTIIVKGDEHDYHEHDGMILDSFPAPLVSAGFEKFTSANVCKDMGTS